MEQRIGRESVTSRVYENQHLALDAAQIRQGVARVEAAAIDDPVDGASRVGGVDAIAQRDIGHGGEAFGQRRHRRARIEMRFTRKKQRFVEAAGEIGLKRGERRGANMLALSRPTREARQFRRGRARARATSEPCVVATGTVSVQ